MIAITIDIDWAPDPVIADTLGLLDEARVRATVFATHKADILKQEDRHEIAIHPKFSGSETEVELDRLLEAFPDARGVRSHGFAHDSRLLDVFVERGLLYDSNIMAYLKAEVPIFRHYNGLVRIPIFWGDYLNCRTGNSWDPSTLPFGAEGHVHVFTFHPVHVYLNTEDLGRYEAAKRFYHDPEKLKTFANPEAASTGARVFLKRLLQFARNRTTTLLEVVQRSIGKRA